MGCTSSTNMSDPQQHSHTTENEKTEINDDKQDDDNLKHMDTNEKKDPEQDESTNLESNKIIMLPTCDTLDQNLQLDRKWNSPQHIVINEQERERADLNDTDVNVIMETNKEIPSIELEEAPSKISTFEKVVNQVVLETILDDMANKLSFKENDSNDSQKSNKTTEENVIQDSPIEINNTTDTDGLEQINDEDDNLDATASPSQSESSRATRWEALADIAAELPPSLAVDPVTGQIFSLTK